MFKKNYKIFPNRLIFNLIFFLITLVLVNIENQKMEQKILGTQTQLKLDQKMIIYWEQILEEKPDYRDGWVQLAAAYYKIGNRQKAKEALSKAKTLDPTNEIIINFEKILGN